MTEIPFNIRRISFMTWLFTALFCSLFQGSKAKAADCCYLECIVAILDTQEYWTDCVMCFCYDLGEPCDPVPIFDCGHNDEFGGYEWVYTCVEEQESCGSPPVPACGTLVPDEIWYPLGYDEVEDALFRELCNSSPSTMPCSECRIGHCWGALDEAGEPIPGYINPFNTWKRCEDEEGC